MSFSLDISNFTKKCSDNSDQLARKVVLEVGKSVIEKTPVGDASYWQSPAPKGYVGGHARGNWSHSEGALDTKEFDVVDPSGNTSNARILSSVPGKAGGKVHFIQNSVPYIQRLEDGYSRQAPNGMVGLTVIEFQSIFNKATGELK